MFWIIYLSGVIIMLILSLLHLHKKKTVYLSDLLTGIVFTALSWTALVFSAFDSLYDWMTKNGHDKRLWNNNDD